MAVYVVGSTVQKTKASPLSLSDLVSEMRSNGHDIVDIPYFDKFYRHRMQDGKRGDLSGWVIASYISNDKICATYGDWKSNTSTNWFSDSGQFTEIERADFQDRIDKIHAEQDAMADKAEKEAVLFLGNCKNDTEAHAYIEAKHIVPYLAKRSGRELIVPMHDIHSGELKCYQRIWIDEYGVTQKRFKGRSGGRACILPGAKNQHPIICEGYATACTIHEATGATVYAAMSTSNVPTVAQILFDRGETAILCPDVNDASKLYPSGAGVAAAVKAQTGKGWPIFKPPIGSDEADGNGDYNDIGVERTREYLAEKIGGWLLSNEANQPTEQLDSDDTELAHPPEIHIIDDTNWESPETSQDNWIEDEDGQAGIIPKEGIGMLFGPSGSGKSFMAADMGLSIATGKKWHTYDAKKGNVLYILGEGRTGFLNRVKSWLKYYELPGSAIQDSFKVTKSRVAINDSTSLGLLRQDLINLDYKPDIIFIDTLAANMDGDENQTQDASRFIIALSMLQYDFQIPNICIIHHTGKGDKYSARGSSVFRASCDYSIRIDIKKNMESGNIIERDIMPEKIKDGREWEPIWFDLLDNDLGERTNWFGKKVHIIVPVIQLTGRPAPPAELPDLDENNEARRKDITGKPLLIELTTRIMDANQIDPDGRILYDKDLKTLLRDEYRARNGGVGETKDITRMLTRADLLSDDGTDKWLLHPVRSPTR